MSNWLSKSSNKKLSAQQVSKTDFATINTDRPSNTYLDRPTALTKSSSTETTPAENSSTVTDEDEKRHRSDKWSFWKHRKRTSDGNNPSASSKFFCFGSNTTKDPLSPSISRDLSRDNALKWDDILDREFQSLDIDADGYVSVADLQSVLKNFSHICNAKEIMFRIFDELDSNRDQRISKQEFKMYKNALIDGQKHFHRLTSEEKLGSIFALFDHNQDNYISAHEVRETMKNLGEPIDDHLIEEMMQIADTNQDGRISRDEFKKLLMRLHTKK